MRDIATTSCSRYLVNCVEGMRGVQTRGKATVMVVREVQEGRRRRSGREKRYKRCSSGRRGMRLGRGKL